MTEQNRIEPSVGNKGGFFGGFFGKTASTQGVIKPRSVSQILGGFNRLVDELRANVTTRQTIRTSLEETIETLRVEIDTHTGEINDAIAAIDGITAMLGKTQSVE